MRRKSRKSAGEKAESNPPKTPISDNDGQSSKKRLSRFDSEPVDDNIPLSIEQSNNSNQGSENLIQNTITAPEDISNDVNNSVNDRSEENIPKDSECEQYGDKEEKDNKGKSKGKSNTNDLSWSRNPEIENDNVQGSSQSPPKDSDENVQNSIETAQINPDENSELNDDGNNVKENVNEQGSAILTQINFESAYVQGTEVKNEAINEGVQTGGNTSEQISCEERSTTPEIKNEKSKSDILNRSQSDDSDRKSSGERKRITLRRMLPKSSHETEELQKSNQDEDAKDKPRKKIILKRHTADQKSVTAEEKADEDKIHIRIRKSSTSEDNVDKKRRLSSQTEEKSPEIEKPRPFTKKVKLIRHIPQANEASESQDGNASRKTRKQVWGKSALLDNLSATMYKIDVDTIKIVCPAVEFLKESEVKLDLVPRMRIKSESDTVKRTLSIEKSEDEKFERQVSEETVDEQKTETNPNVIALNRKICIVDDTTSKLRPPPSPPKNSRSEILYITNLVRPFTVKQLKELLERTGKIREDGFWTDRIKSKCYVHYESEEEAEATRNALHGVFWPIGNGKRLVIDYGTAEDMEKAKKPVPAAVVTPVVPEKIPEKENREPEKVDNRQSEHERSERQRHTPVREWSKIKEETHRRRSRSRSKSRDHERVRKHSHRSYTPEIVNKKKHRKTEEPVPQKLMDDLFLKTKATPSIYWQPLTPQEIMTKQQQRLVRMEQHKRRIEETRGRLRDVRRAPFRRR